MSVPASVTDVMRTVRFHTNGEPQAVLRLDEVRIPTPNPGHLRIRVHGCGLNPADWALCRGLFPGKLPRGIGLDVAGIVDALGDGVVGVRIGDRVLGPANFVDYASAGLSDYAILSRWAHVPPGLDLVEAAALPMAVQTAYGHLTWLGVKAGQTLLVNGGGTMIGFAAVQMALLRGARVITTAGETYTERLRALGAAVTPYGAGSVQRVRAIVGGSPDLIFDTAPVNLNLDAAHAASALPDLVEIAGGDPRRILTCVDFAGAAKLGVRSTFHEDQALSFDVLQEFAQLAAEGKFTVPIARTFALETWSEALDISLNGHAHGKLIILP